MIFQTSHRHSSFQIFIPCIKFHKVPMGFRYWYIFPVHWVNLKENEYIWAISIPVMPIPRPVRTRCVSPPWVCVTDCCRWSCSTWGSCFPQSSLIAAWTSDWSPPDARRWQQTAACDPENRRYIACPSVCPHYRRLYWPRCHQTTTSTINKTWE